MYGVAPWYQNWNGIMCFLLKTHTLVLKWAHISPSKQESFFQDIDVLQKHGIVSNVTHDVSDTKCYPIRPSTFTFDPPRPISCSVKTLYSHLNRFKINWAIGYFTSSVWPKNVADIKKMKVVGICTVKGIQMTTRKALCNIKGLSEAKVEKIKEAAGKMLVKKLFCAVNCLL